jgi:RNA-directed DNA polymerase
MGETLSSQTVSTKLDRIATLAKQVPTPLTTLAHHIDIEWLREALPSFPVLRSLRA